MKVTEIHDSEFLSAIGRSIGPRSTGLHLSDIIHDLESSLQRKRKQYADLPYNYFEAGFVYELAMERALAERHNGGVLRPGEVFSPEGIAMSPDGLNLVREAGEEYKWTQRSGRFGLVDEYGMPLPQFRRWFWQISEYAYALGINRFIIRPCFSNGNYEHGKSGAPAFREFEVEFTKEEMQETHEMLVRHARSRGML